MTEDETGVDPQLAKGRSVGTRRGADNQRLGDDDGGATAAQSGFTRSGKGRDAVSAEEQQEQHQKIEHDKHTDGTPEPRQDGVDREGWSRRCWTRHGSGRCGTAGESLAGGRRRHAGTTSARRRYRLGREFRGLDPLAVDRLVLERWEVAGEGRGVGILDVELPGDAAAKKSCKGLDIAISAGGIRGERVGEDAVDPERQREIRAEAGGIDWGGGATRDAKIGDGEGSLSGHHRRGSGERFVDDASQCIDVGLRGDDATLELFWGEVGDAERGVIRNGIDWGS